MDSSRKIEVAANDAVKKLGYEKLKELQLEVITGIVNGHDVFAVMPTGYGKSLCYGCLPRVFDTLYQTCLSIHCLCRNLSSIHKLLNEFLPSGEYSFTGFRSTS